MLDRRFPVIARIDEAPPEVRRSAEEVARRTGTTPLYNKAVRKIIWVYGSEVTGGPLQVQAKRYESHEIDRMVEYIQMGKIGRKAKDRIAVSNAAMEEHDRKEQNGRMLADRRPDALKRAAFLDRKRRGTATAVVALSKGTRK